MDFEIKNGVLERYRGNSLDVVIPEGVHTIDMLAFSSELKTELTSLQLPESLEVIENWAFDRCEKLERIVIPAAVKKIGRGAFNWCRALREVFIEGSPQIEESAFGWTPWEETEFKKTGAKINGNILLEVHPELTEYTIPANIKIIGQSAFQMSKIRKLTVPEGVAEIEFYAFEGSALEEITLPKSLRFIRGGAFANCANLKELTIQKGIRYINSDAFVNLTNCTLTILSGAEENGIDHFESPTSVKEVYAPYGSSTMRAALLSGIPFHALPGKPRKYHYINDEFCCLGTTLFRYLGHQEIVNIPEGIEVIGKDAFNLTLNCPQIKHVHLPSSTTHIEENAFVGCKQLETIDGGNVQQIGIHSFSGCKKLKRVEFPNLKQCYDVSFKGCSELYKKNIIIPADAEIIELAPEPYICGCGRCVVIRTPFKKVVVPIPKRFKRLQKMDFIELPLELAGEAKQEMEQKTNSDPD